MAGPDPLAHFPCNACNALAMDGTAITPVSLDQLDSGSHHCPSCSPYTLRSGLTDDMRNGGERLGFHTYYENPSVSLPLSVHPQSSSPLSYCSPSDTFPPPPRSYSTDVWPLLHCTGTHTHTHLQRLAHAHITVHAHIIWREVTHKLSLLIEPHGGWQIWAWSAAGKYYIKLATLLFKKTHILILVWLLLKQKL